MLATLLEFGLIIVGGDPPTPFGASAITDDSAMNAGRSDAGVDPKFLARGEALGKRVAERARWLSSGRPKPAEGKQGGATRTSPTPPSSDPPSLHSVLKDVVGSTCAARRAGARLATADARSTVPMAPIHTTGSAALTP